VSSDRDVDASAEVRNSVSGDEKDDLEVRVEEDGR